MQSSDLNELNEWAPKMLAKMQAIPELRDVASDQQTEGTTLTLTINRDQASRYGLTTQTIDDTLYAGVWRSTILSPNARFEASPSVVATGSSLAQRRVANEQRQSTPSSKLAN
jgi:multidrug efflux pump subunit AcrB